MNLLIASSRGGGLDKLIEPGLKMVSHIKPGGTLSQLEDIIKKSVPSPRPLHTEQTHIYIIAGIPDITHKIHGDTHTPKYTECIYTGKKEETIEEIKQKMENIQTTIESKNAKPIFCTITNINISHYNNHLLKTKKTNTLHHSQQYDAMQEDITYIIDQLNHHIKRVNYANKVSTPFLHSAVRTRKGNKKKKYFYSDNWDRLYDGIHATTNTRKQWAKTLSRSITLNRKGGSIHSEPTSTKRKPSFSSDDEIKSPKRAWRRERNLE